LEEKTVCQIVEALSLLDVDKDVWVIYYKTFYNRNGNI
jgi:hypothetical protein